VHCCLACGTCACACCVVHDVCLNTFCVRTSTCISQKFQSIFPFLSCVAAQRTAFVNVLVVESGASLSHALRLYSFLRAHSLLALSGNALTTLPNGVFGALGNLTYVGPSPLYVPVFLLSVRGIWASACCTTQKCTASFLLPLSLALFRVLLLSMQHVCMCLLLCLVLNYHILCVYTNFACAQGTIF